jgi:hypothetical protein
MEDGKFEDENEDEKICAVAKTLKDSSTDEHGFPSGETPA